jgi:protein tyrosine phosphatase
MSRQGTKESTPIGLIPLSEFKGASEEVAAQEFGHILRLPRIPVFKFTGPDDPRCKKNRYIDVLPSVEHRVKLAEYNNEYTDYINADLFPGEGKILPGANHPFIAACAPTSEARADFWSMVWEQQCELILMLTGLVENSVLKAEVYWPHGDETLVIERPHPDPDILVPDILVRSTCLPLKHDHFVVRKFSVALRNPNENEHLEEDLEVTHLWFLSWPDRQVPYGSLVSYFTTYRGYRELSDPSRPILCHCSAGIGRTGSFMAIDMVLDSIAVSRLRSEKLTNPYINVFDVVSQLRT